MTRQKQAVLVEMARLRELRLHPTVDEVFAAVRQKLPRISLATVYRNLERLAEQGAIRKIDVPNAPMRFDGNTEPHHHVRCLSCGMVDDLPQDISLDVRPGVTEVRGYRVVGCCIEVVGLCPDCQGGVGEASAVQVVDDEDK